MSDPDASAGPAAVPEAPFRPRRGRVLPLVMGAVAVVVCAVVAVGMGSAAFLGRYASIRAVPDDVGLTVRNLMLTRRVTWDEVLEVRFPDGAPWVTLELDDTDEVAVMAIQRADGDLARAESRRLAAIVARHWDARA